MYKLFSNVVPRALLRHERAFSPRRRKTLTTKLNILISFSNSHESNNEDPDSDSANKAYSKKVGKKKKIIKDRSYERDSNRASAEMHLS